MSLILNQAQAQAVYNAMCELNNVSARIDAKSRDFWVFEKESGAIDVCPVVKGIEYEGETHANQSAFATAYGLV